MTDMIIREVAKHNQQFAVVGWAHHGGVVVSPVRVAKSGNVIALDDDQKLKGVTVRATVEEAIADGNAYWARQEKRTEKRTTRCPFCAAARKNGEHHNLEVINHDASRCRHCGAEYLFPDA